MTYSNELEFVCIPNCIAHNIGYNKCDGGCLCHCHSNIPASIPSIQSSIDEEFAPNVFTVTGNQHEDIDGNPTNELTIWISNKEWVTDLVTNAGVQTNVDPDESKRMAKILKPFKYSTMQILVRRKDNNKIGVSHKHVFHYL